jgi:hypothetical protein
MKQKISPIAAVAIVIVVVAAIVGIGYKMMNRLPEAPPIPKMSTGAGLGALPGKDAVSTGNGNGSASGMSGGPSLPGGGGGMTAPGTGGGGGMMAPGTPPEAKP